MNPLVIVVPVLAAGGAVAYYLLTRGEPTPPSTNLAPPPGPVAITSGGARYQTYIKQLNDASIAYSMAKVIGGTALTAAKTESLAALDVVGTMAQSDLIQARITQLDMDQIKAKITQIKATIG
jgi:hypothetical protein